MNKSRNRRSLAIVLIALVLVFTMQRKVHALAIVYDACSFAGSLAVTMVYDYLANSAADMVGVKKDNTKKYVAHQKIIAAEIEAQKTAQTSMLSAAIKQHALARNVLGNNLIYSPLGQSSFACCEETRAAGMVSGMRSLPLAKEDIYDAMENYNNQPLSPNQAYELVAAAAKNQSFLSGRPLLPTEATISPANIELATYTGALLTNPAIDFEPPAKYLVKEVGKRYQAMRSLKQAKVELSQIAIAHIIGRKSPIYPVEDWMRQMSRSIGISENHPDVKSGMVSAEAMLNMEVASRYANPAYLTDIHRKTEAGILRELLVTEAILMDLKRVELETQQYMTALMASRSSTHVQNGLNEVLEHQYRQAILQAR